MIIRATKHIFSINNKKGNSSRRKLKYTPARGKDRLEDKKPVRGANLALGAKIDLVC